MKLKLQMEYDPNQLHDFDRGYIDGLTAFAWWKDGTQYVGTCGTTLEAAIRDYLKAKGYLKVPSLAPNWSQAESGE